MNERLKSIVDLEKYPIHDLNSPIIKKLVEILTKMGKTVQVVSVDEIQMEARRKGHNVNPYKKIQQMFNSSSSDFFIVDTTLVSGKVPIEGMRVFYLNPIGIRNLKNIGSLQNKKPKKI